MPELYPVHVYMFRHAEGEHQLHPDNMAGRANHVPLTERGRLQPARLGRVLAAQGLRPQAAFTSPAIRAADTGRMALDTAGLSDMQIIVQDDLQELGRGPWEGRPRSEAYPPEIQEEIQIFGKDFRLEGGESMNDVAKRGFGWLERTFPWPTIEPEAYFVFTHAGLIKSIAGKILNLEHDQLYRTSIDNTSANLFVGSGSKWKVAYLNADAAHIQPDVDLL